MQQTQKKPELVSNASAPSGLHLPECQTISVDTDVGPMTPPAGGPAPPPTSPTVGLPFFDQNQFASSIDSVLAGAEWTGRFASQEEQKK